MNTTFALIEFYILSRLFPVHVDVFLLCFCYVQALPDAGEAVCCLDKVWFSDFSLLRSDFPSLLTEYWISGKKNKAGLDDSYELLLLLAGDVTVEGDINSDVELS